MTSLCARLVLGARNTVVTGMDTGAHRSCLQSSGEWPGPDKSLPIHKILRVPITVGIKFKLLHDLLCAPLQLPHPLQQPLPLKHFVQRTISSPFCALAHATPTTWNAFPCFLDIGPHFLFPKTLSTYYQAELAISPLSS